MVKNIITKRILITSIALFAIAMFSFIPKETSNNLDKIKQELEYVDIEIKTHNIFLLDINNYVALTKVIVQNDDTVKLAKELLEILIVDGIGQSKVPSGFRSIIPSGTQIIDVTYDNNTLKLNFTKEFLEVNKNVEEKLLESIIFTMTSIKGVDKVIIYIEGEILTKLPKTGRSLPSTFERSYGINKAYDINNIKDVVGITVYYVNEHNNNYYYVPVTTYVNDKREKISIIIDELTNNFIHVDNLMSFLNQDVKLLSSSIENNVMTLSFNEAIFNSINEKNILEEVIYTISLSIGDNYNVDEVLFNVENNEICKKSLE